MINSVCFELLVNNNLFSVIKTHLKMRVHFI